MIIRMGNDGHLTTENKEGQLIIEAASCQKTASAPLTPPYVWVSYTAVHQTKEISSRVSFNTDRCDL
jgi:hypothetical protein